MNKIIISVCLIIISVFTLSAQNDFTGKIRYKIDVNVEENISPEIMAMMPKEIIVYIDNGQICTDMKTSFMSQKNIVDTRQKKIFCIMDMMGTCVTIADTFDAYLKNADKKISEIKPHPTGKKKNIAGYECDEIIINYEQINMPIYVTNQIGFKDMYADNPIYSGIDGCMMEFELEQNGIKLKMEAQSVEKCKIDKKLFEVPSGCKIMNLKQASEIQNFNF